MNINNPSQNRRIRPQASASYASPTRDTTRQTTPADFCALANLLDIKHLADFGSQRLQGPRQHASAKTRPRACLARRGIDRRQCRATELVPTSDTGPVDAATSANSERLRPFAFAR